MKKTRALAAFLAIILLLSVTACSSIKNSLGLDDNDKTTYSKKFQKGVPSMYKGYYGRFESYGGQTHQFNGLKFQDSQMAMGLGDRNILDEVQYKQLNKNTFIIRGKDNHYGNQGWQYEKIGFKVKHNKTYIGVYGNDKSNVDPASLEQVKKQSTSHIDWYKNYTQVKYKELMKENGDKSSKKSSDTSSASVDANYFDGKIFRSDNTKTEFLSFNADDQGGTQDEYFVLYNVSANGDPSQVAMMQDPTYTVKGNKLTVTGTGMPNREFNDANKKVYTIISATEIKDADKGYTYTLFDDTFQDCIDQIAAEQGYFDASDPDKNDSNDSSDDSNSDYDNNDDYDADDYD